MKTELESLNTKLEEKNNEQNTTTDELTSKVKDLEVAMGEKDKQLQTSKSKLKKVVDRFKILQEQKAVDWWRAQQNSVPNSYVESLLSGFLITALSMQIFIQSIDFSLNSSIFLELIDFS